MSRFIETEFSRPAKDSLVQEITVPNVISRSS